MSKEAAKALEFSGQLWRKGIPAAMVIFLMGGAAWATRIHWSQASASERIQKLEKSVGTIKKSLQEIREGRTPYQIRQEQQRRDDLQQIKELIRERFPRRRDSRPSE